MAAAKPLLFMLVVSGVNETEVEEFSTSKKEKIGSIGHVQIGPPPSTGEKSQLAVSFH